MTRGQAEKSVDELLATLSSHGVPLSSDETVRADSYGPTSFAATVAAESAGPGASAQASGGRPMSATNLLASLPRIAIADTNGPPEGLTGAEGPTDLEIVGLLGEGGMGRVYAAQQRSLERQVAIKIVARDDALAALLREARLMGSLEHPGVVPVHALGVDATGQPVLVMKRIEGTSWTKLIEEDATAEGLVPASKLPRHLEILMQVASTLAFAHARGILHRDVKPDNVLVGKFGEVYLADWGIALDRSRLHDEVSATVGTPAFMAPEMFWGDPSGADVRTDVYLLGATLHVLLSGTPRHQGTTVREVLLHAARSEPVAYSPSVPAELAALANRATSLAPEDRHQDAFAFREAVADYLRHRGAASLALKARESLGDAERLLEGDATADARVRARQRLAEARFGFSQALAEWPEHTGARDGLDRAVDLAFGLELDEGAVGAARALLQDLGTPREDLEARADEVERALATEAEENRRLRKLAREHDPGVSSGARTALLAFFAVAAGGLTIGMRSMRLAGDGLPAPHTPLLPLAVGLVLAPAIYAARRSLAASRVNKKLVIVLYIGILLAAGLRAIAYVVHTPIDHVMAYELVLVSSVTALLGVYVARPFLAAAAFAFAATAGVLAVPAFLEVFYVPSILAVAFASYLVGRHPPAELKAPPDASRRAR